MALDTDLGVVHTRALEQSRRIVEGIRPDQMTGPTPCARWTVRDLLNHLVASNLAFVSAAQGDVGPRSRRPDLPDFLGGDPLAAHTASREQVTRAFAAPDAMERTWTLPIGDMPGPVARNIHITETVAHSWDLASATGQTERLDPEVAEATLSLARATLPESFRNPQGDPFAAAVDVPDTAPAYDRLAGFLGRRPMEG